MPHYLSIGGCFKNEAHCIVEWVEHYLLHGVDHIYLVNDGSTDDSVEKLQPYIDRGVVTLFNEINHPYYLGRQRNFYNVHFMPILRAKETEWLFICDLDEFLWSEIDTDLKKVFKMCEHLSQIQFVVTLFGSNGHIKQPESLVESFTKRSADLETPQPKCVKYAVRSKYNWSSLNVHHADWVEGEVEAGTFIKMREPYFRVNHYSCQSREFWDVVKCTRGDADNYITRLPEHFSVYDHNDVEDMGLVNQNRQLRESRP